MNAQIENVIEPTFAELAQLADALWDDDKFAAASRIYLQAAALSRRHRFYTHEATALLFA